jgi:hypothetical protein
MKKQFIILLPIISFLLTACGSGSSSNNTKPLIPQLSSLPTAGYYIGSATSSKAALQTFAFGTIIGGGAIIETVSSQGSGFIGGELLLNNNTCFRGVQVINGQDMPFSLSGCTFINNTLKGSYTNGAGDEGTISITLNTAQLTSLPTPSVNYTGTITSSLMSFTSPITGNVAVNGSANFNITNNAAPISGKFKLNDPACFLGTITVNGLLASFSLVNCTYQNGALHATYYYTYLINPIRDAGIFIAVPN